MIGLFIQKQIVGYFKYELQLHVLTTRSSIFFSYSKWQAIK